MKRYSEELGLNANEEEEEEEYLIEYKSSHGGGPPQELQSEHSVNLLDNTSINLYLNESSC